MPKNVQDVCLSAHCRETTAFTSCWLEGCQRPRPSEEAGPETGGSSWVVGGDGEYRETGRSDHTSCTAGFRFVACLCFWNESLKSSLCSFFLMWTQHYWQNELPWKQLCFLLNGSTLQTVTFPWKMKSSPRWDKCSPGPVKQTGGFRLSGVTESSTVRLFCSLSVFNVPTSNV